MDKKIAEEMIELAIKQLDFSYVPYSGFKVGAALRTNSFKFSYAFTDRLKECCSFCTVCRCVPAGNDGVL